MSHNFLKIKQSLIHGNGIFTNRNIFKGDVFYTVPMQKVFDSPVSKCAKISKNKWVCDDEVLNWVNHSCRSNTRLDTSRKVPMLVALEDIEIGDEIVVDYNLTETGGELVSSTSGEILNHSDPREIVVVFDLKPLESHIVPSTPREPRMINVIGKIMILMY